ncbi:hypothetical protein ACNJKD_00120 [Edwardsiella tarda]|uniref:hypothetical protein n=1 Tax=Edwardsiella tarda TaxID=636 RepID=UPI003A85E03A
MIRTFSVLCVFFLINGFYIVQPFNSAMLVPFIAILGLVLFRQTFKVKNVLFLTDFKFLLFFCFMVSYCLCISVFSGTYDFSYFKNFASQFVQLIIIISSFAILSSLDKRFSFDIERIIVYGFVLQSIIQVLAFLYPSVADFVHLFYDKDKVERLYVNYSGGRGLALTGSPGWGISIGYAISFLLFTKAFLLNQKIKLSSIVIAITLVVGALFTGRSAFVGVFFSGIYYLLSGEAFLKKIKTVAMLLTLPVFIFLLLYIMFPSFSSLLIDKVFPFVFEFYYKYKSTGEISTKSTDILYNMWNINVGVSDIIYGTGWFTNPQTNEYYFGTDVGYLRNLLYGGLFWMVALVIYQFLLFGDFKRLNKDRNIKLFIFIFIFMLMLLEVKAMSIGYNKYVFTVSVLLGLSFKDRYRNGH